MNNWKKGLIFIKIYNAKDLATKIKNDIKKEIEDYIKKGYRKPQLIVIQANNDSSSDLYINNKMKICDEVGIHCTHIKLEESITTESILNLINYYNSNKCIHGILVQLPLYEHLDKEKIMQSISPEKDVDGFNYLNIGKSYSGITNLIPLTALGVVDILKDNKVNIQGKHAIVLGRSIISGKPIADLLLQHDATVTICHSKTQNLKEICKQADILVTCVGVSKLIDSTYIKDDAIIVNVGFSNVDGKTYGDIDLEDIELNSNASIVTSIFNTTGLMTTVNLAKSLMYCYKKLNGIEG